MDKVIEKATRIAAELLEAAVVDVELAEGKFTIAGTDRSVDLAAVGQAAYDPARIPPGRERRPGRERGVHPDRCHLPERHAYLRG